MAKNGLIKLILDALQMENEIEMLLDSLHVLDTMLTVGEKQAAMGKEKNEFLIKLDIEGGTKIIERLQSHREERVSLFVYKLIEEFFVSEELV